MDGKVVSEAKFKEKTKNDPFCPFINCLRVPLEAKIFHLGQQVFPTLNGPRDNLGKKSGKIHEVKKPGEWVLVDYGIDDKSHHLKGVK